MQVKCLRADSSSVKSKGIEKIFLCRAGNPPPFEDLSSLKVYIEKVLETLSLSGRVEFSENESIGTTHMLYKFHVMNDGRRCASVRAVLKDRALQLLAFVFSEGCPAEIKTEEGTYSTLEGKILKGEGIPPGQKVIEDFIIYRILGQPEISIDSWRLKVYGEVEKPLELSYGDLLSMKLRTIKADFHCVTGWSVKDIEWEGVPTEELAKMAGVKKSARWVLTHSLDNYTAIIPIEDFLVEGSIIALRINGRELSKEQGFPARLFIPHLYGWKGGKWLRAIEFRKDYTDGYWEALGYHERGNVWLEERFKRL